MAVRLFPVRYEPNPYCYAEESRPPLWSSRVPGYTTEMYCVSCEVRTEFIYVMQKKVDRLCGLVVRVPGYITEMYCVSCKVRTEFIYVLRKKVDRLCACEFY
jgi:predicted nucleic acid-binding protein